MASLHHLVLLVVLVSAVQSGLVEVSKAEEDLFIFHQKLRTLHRILQTECPGNAKLKRALDDNYLTTLDAEATKITYNNLLSTLMACRINAAKLREMTTSRPGLRDCQEYYDQGSTISGVYLINLATDNFQPFEVWCDFFDGHGWTVYQKRFDGSVNFYRDWLDYKEGFGKVTQEYWLGLDKIHALTQTNELLNINVTAVNGQSQFGNWQSFVISGEEDNYRLKITDEYSGTLNSYGLFNQNGMPFTTKDRDNDLDIANCAVYFHGAWWYNSCFYSNLNGAYAVDNTSTIDWYPYTSPIIKTVMRVSRN